MIDQFTKEEFEQLLELLVSKYAEKLLAPTHVLRLGLVEGEYTYRIALPEAAFVAFRSSVDRSGFAGATGQDSIRIWVCDVQGKGLLSKKQRWVTRQFGWRERLEEQFVLLLDEWLQYGAQLRRAKASGLRFLRAKYPGFCRLCKKPFEEGELIAQRDGKWGHFECPLPAPTKLVVNSEEAEAALEFFAASGLTVETRDEPIAPKVFTPSKYQLGIFDWWKNGTGHGIVRAVAGSGKSTTLVKMLELIPPDMKAIYLAFNKRIVQDFRERQERGEIPKHIEIRTLNSLGLKNLIRIFQVADRSSYVDEDKLSIVMNGFDPLVRKREPDDPRGRLTTEERIRAIAKRQLASRLASLCRGTMLDALRESRRPEALWNLIDHYGIDYSGLEGDEVEEVLALVPQILQACADNLAVIDFEDQCWLPVQLGLDLEKYDFIGIDETQDLNAVQIQFVLRSLARGGRILAVGDANQSLYGFRGADTEAMDRIEQALQAERLPLSISYRCTRANVKLAQRIVPEIEAREDAPEGLVAEITAEQVAQIAQPGDMIICRVNAPLVPLAYRLIRKGLKAVVVGTEIGKGLLDLVEKFQAANLVELSVSVNELQERETLRLTVSEKWGQLQAMQDRTETLQALIAESESIGDLVNKIKTLFSEEARGVVLSSIHRAKGLEADRVFLLRPDLLPHPLAKQPWMKQQEANAEYVAVTRNLQEFFYVVGKEG